MTKKKPIERIEKIDLSKLEIEVIKELRNGKFKMKQPFMINDNSLPSMKCYFEHKDGRIELARLQNGKYITEKELNPLEKWEVRKKHRLLSI